MWAVERNARDGSEILARVGAPTGSASRGPFDRGGDRGRRGVVYRVVAQKDPVPVLAAPG